MARLDIRNRRNEKSFPSESRTCILSPLPGNVTRQRVSKVQARNRKAWAVPRNADAIPILISSNISSKWIRQIDRHASARVVRVTRKRRSWRGGRARDNSVKITFQNEKQNQKKKKKKEKKKKKRKKLWNNEGQKYYIIYAYAHDWRVRVCK